MSAFLKAAPGIRANFHGYGLMGKRMETTPVMELPMSDTVEQGQGKAKGDACVNLSLCFAPD